MNIPVRDVTAAQKLAIVDCDIHPVQRAKSDLAPFMEARWREHMATFGGHIRQGLWAGQNVYPRMMAGGRRKDAFPPGGGAPGSDLETMQKQHLDANGVEVGMLIPGNGSGFEERNLDYGAALAHAVNEWQLEYFCRKEPRLRAGLVVPQENAAAAVKEIELRAADRSFSQVLISPRANEPLGRRATGRSTRRSRRRACRSASTTPTSTADIPPPAPAGRPITCRSTTPSCRTSRRWW